MPAADVRYRCCEHCSGDWCPPVGHAFPCSVQRCPGRMPIDPETEG